MQQGGPRVLREMSCVIRCSSHWPCALCTWETEFFIFILIHLNINSHIWLVVAILGSTGQRPKSWEGAARRKIEGTYSIHKETHTQMFPGRKILICFSNWISYTRLEGEGKWVDEKNKGNLSGQWWATGGASLLSEVIYLQIFKNIIVADGCVENIGT